MFSRFFGNNKLKLVKLRELLVQAYKHIWQNELTEAKSLLDRVRVEIKAQIQKDSNAAEILRQLNFEVKLGLWAIQYLQDQNHRSDIQKVFDRGGLNADTAYFIAKLFQSRGDVSPQALSAYKALLSFNTSAEPARQIADLLKRSDYSNSALQLLATIVDILRDDIELSNRLCRWYLIAKRDEDARKLAYKIIGLQPKNTNANRCLAVVAERRQDWLEAAEYYKVSEDKLRAAVVLAKANEFVEAHNLIMSVSPDQGSRPTWLYYHGWITFNQGDFSTALNSWRRLMEEHPDCHDLIADAIRVTHDRLLHEQFTLSELSVELAPEAIGDSSYQALVALKIGATRLLKDNDFIRASPLLEKAFRVRRSDIHAATYLMLSRAIEKDNRAVDKQIYQKLAKHFRDTSLFMWLRGLYLLKIGRNIGLKYLQKAYQDGVHKHHIPIEAVAVTNWICSRMNSGKPVDISQGEVAEVDFSIMGEKGLATLFQRAAISSYTLQQMENGRDVTWIVTEAINPIDSSVWGWVQTAFYLYENDWHRAATSINRADPVLARRIISSALQDAVQQQDWCRAAEHISLGLELNPNDVSWRRIEQQLRPQMRQMLWQQKQLETLDFDLEKQLLSGTADTSIYHGMAVVYTHLAIAKDQKAAVSENSDATSTFTMTAHRAQLEHTDTLEGQTHNDYWQLAIGYWAVALTDASYWEFWAERRGNVMGETIKSEQIRELTQKTIPQMLRSYHQDNIHRNSAFSAHHHFYASIVNYEVESTQAVRHLMRAAEHQQFKLPSEFAMFISPLLIKKYGYESQGREIVAQFDELRLSPYEAGLIRTAFSPISDAKALIDFKAYGMALETLRKLLINEKYTVIHSEVRRELCLVLELSIEEAMELERWGDALALTTEGRELEPKNENFILLASAATIGWANSQIRQDEYSEAIQQLESFRLTLQQRNPEIDALLCDAYVEWAYEAGRENNTEAVLNRFAKAVSINPDNERARYGLNAVYYMRAIDKAAEQQDYVGALKDAEIALKYHENRETIILTAKLHRTFAINFDERGQYQMAAPHWTKAWDYALKQFNMSDTQDSLHFLVEIGIANTLALYSYNALEDAISLAETLIQMPYDRNAFKIDLNKLLSELYTNLGVEFYNAGNYWHGRQLTQKALEYDSNNHTALQNLYDF